MNRILRTAHDLTPVLNSLQICKEILKRVFSERLWLEFSLKIDLENLDL